MHPDHCIIYILTNKAMPDYIKIGTTRRPVQDRMRDLYTSGLPVPFQCHYAAEVPKTMNVERRLHRAFDKFRVNENREFFELDPEAAADILRMIAVKDATPEGEVVETSDDKDALQKLEKRAERFSFKMVGIAPDTILRFKLDEDVTCRVLDNRNVELNGEKTSLSAAVLTVMRARGTEWKAAQGAAYWMHEGQTLKELRDQLEDAD